MKGYIEEWRDVKEYEGFYKVSNSGIVKGLRRIITRKNGAKQEITEKIITPSMVNSGYLKVMLNRKDKRKGFFVHHLVWDAFGNKERNGRIKQVDHIDNCKTNNHIDNLQVLTARQNVVKNVLRRKPAGWLPGVCDLKTSFTAVIYANRKKHSIGNYKTKEEAYACYLRAVKHLEGGNDISTFYKNAYKQKSKSLRRRRNEN